MTETDATTEATDATTDAEMNSAAPATLIERAWNNLDGGDLDAARTSAAAALDSADISDGLRGEGYLICAQVLLLDSGGSGEGVANAREALNLSVRLLEDDAEVLTDAANLAIALGDFELSAAIGDRAAAADPKHADAAYVRGLAADALGDTKTRMRCFLRTAELDGDEPDPSWALSVDDFTAVAERALDELPEAAKVHLENVPVIIEAAPSAELLAEGIDPRLFGLFSGTPLPDKSVIAEGAPSLDAIHIYQRNLERDCFDGSELEEQIRITVLHETAHFFGLDEHDLEEIGLD